MTLRWRPFATKWAGVEGPRLTVSACRPSRWQVVREVSENGKALARFIDYAVTKPEVRFVTYSDLIRWMQVRGREACMYVWFGVCARVGGWGGGGGGVGGDAGRPWLARQSTVLAETPRFCSMVATHLLDAAGWWQLRASATSWHGQGT